MKRVKIARKLRSERSWEIASNFLVDEVDYRIACRTRTVTDIDECQAIWQAVIPSECIFDLWDVRSCFQQHFKRPVIFIVVEDSQGISGLLPLSFIEELNCFGFFPGETWHGKTWLEQNRLYFRNGGPQEILSRFAWPYHLRYLSPQPGWPQTDPMVDEIGYLFSPPKYDYDIKNYFADFSHKSIKQILRDVGAFEKLGASYRYDDISDFDLMMQLNISRFGTASYFWDTRFRESFRSLAHYLNAKGWLRFTTVLINDEPAAVDMGCMYNGVYTVMAGGTNGRFPGVAKLINLHHIERACRERLQQVDFLCGDFNWKKMFHLTPRPLFLLSNLPSDLPEPANPEIALQSIDVR